MNQCGYFIRWLLFTAKRTKCIHHVCFFARLPCHLTLACSIALRMCVRTLVIVVSKHHTILLA